MYEAISQSQPAIGQRVRLLQIFPGCEATVDGYDDGMFTVDLASAKLTDDAVALGIGPFWGNAFSPYDYEILPDGPEDSIPAADVAAMAPTPILPTDKQARKETPIARGVLDYFPLAIAEVARVSYVGNQQHNPGEPMHWARGKSTDHADCIVRHLIERGTVDDDGMRHTAKAAWRALALLQEELEAARDEK